MRYRWIEPTKGRHWRRWRIVIGVLVALVPLSYGGGSWVAHRFQWEADKGFEVVRERTQETAGRGSEAATGAEENALEKGRIEFEEAAGYIAEQQGLLERRATEQSLWQVARVETGIFPGDWVRIESHGSARLWLKGWGNLELSEGADCKLGNGKVELVEGTVRLRMPLSKKVFTVATAAGTVLGSHLDCSVSFFPYDPKVQVTVHSGQVTLRNEAGKVVLRAGVQASARPSEAPQPQGARPPEVMEQSLTGRVLEVKGTQLRVQTEGGLPVTLRVGAEKREGVWQVARVGKVLRTLRVGELVTLHYWSDAEDQWLTKVIPQPPPSPRPAEEPSTPMGEGELSGEVRSPTGQPLPEVEVVLHDAGGLLERAITDARGQFEMAHIPAGPYRLLARSPDGRFAASAKVQVVPNQTTAVLLHLEADAPRKAGEAAPGGMGMKPNGAGGH